MSVREDILELFEQNRGKYLSGEELAARFNVSRSAVWKAVKQLEAEGYEFDASTGRGYSLRIDSDVISKSGIEKYLGNEAGRYDIRVYKTVTSTNTVLKEMAADGAAEGTYFSVPL